MTRFLAILLSLLFAACARDNIDIIKEQEVRTTTKEILTFQDRPQQKALEYRWKAVRTYEEFIRANRGYRGEAMAKSMQELADIYMEIEENTYLQKRGKVDHASSRRLYQEVLDLYPDRPENEDILYQLSRGYMEEGDWDTSNSLLERIVREFPNGKFTREAYFRLGEYYFQYGDRPRAIHYYRQVLKRDDYNFYDKSLYKLGWALFQGRDYEAAADKFISLLERKGVKLTPEGKEVVKDLQVVERDMIWDTIKTLILVFDYMGGHSRIADYFKVRGVQSFEPYIYRRLGDIYLGTGRFKEATEIYEAFVNTNPLHEDAPSFQSKIVEAYTIGNMPDLAYNARIRLIETYREDSLWFKANRRTAQKRAKEVVQLNKALVKNDMLQIARHRYANARSSKKGEDFKEAVVWLRRFLSNFPDETEATETTFLLAEILFEMKEFHHAFIEHEKVAYRYPASRFSAEAGYGVLLSLEKLAKPSGTLRTDSPYAIKLAEMCRTFAKTWPQDKRSPEALLTATDIFSQRGHFEEVRSLSQMLIESAVSSDREKYLAQKFIAESFLKEQAYNRSEEEIRKAIARVPASDRKDLPLLEKGLAASLYKQAEGLKARGRTTEAAEAFEKVYQSVPKSDIASVALYDAGVLYEQDREWDKAIKTYSLLYQKYPDSRYTFDALTHWGEIKEQLRDYAMAAQAYEKAAERAPDLNLREELSYKVVSMYEISKDINGFYTHYREFRDRFPESRRMLELTYRVAVSRESVKDMANAKTLYERVVLIHKKSGADASIEESALAARAQLILSNYQKSLFEGIRLVQPLEENLIKKETLLKEALTSYTSAAKYRISDITTEATHKMGEMLEHLKEAIMESERPGELTPEQLEEYDFLLEEQAYPFEEKAITVYEGNMRRTTEAGIYDAWVKKSYERLAGLLPARYKREEAGNPFSGDLSAAMPDDAGEYNSLGIWRRENGEFKKAEEEYLKSISIQSDFPDPFLNLGILYEMYLDRPEEALKNYKEYVRLGGKREDVLVWIDILEKRMNKQ